MGKYIDKADRRDQYTCARICVEVDLEVGLPKAINITVAEWSYVQDMRNFPLSADFVMVMDIFPELARKKLRKKLIKKKEINGPKFKNQTQ